MEIGAMMISKKVLVATSSKARREQLTTLFESLQAKYQLVLITTLATLDSILEYQTIDRCLVDVDLLTSAAVHDLQAASLLKRTIAFGPTQSEQAIWAIQQGIADFIDIDHDSAFRLRLALERPLPPCCPKQPSNLTALIENAHSIHALIDLDGNFNYLNPAGVDVLGNLRSLAQFCGQICRTSDKVHIESMLRQVRQQGRWHTEIVYHPADGQPSRDLLIRIIPLYAADETTLIGYGLLAHDVTTLKIANRQLEETIAQKLALNQLKEGFIATISHELRTPLATILTSADLLMQYGDRLSAQRKQDRLAKIKTQVRRMVALLDEVLLIERLDDANTTLHTAAVDINALIKELVNDLCEQHQTTHNIVIRGSVSANYVADANLLRQALSNLLSNAIKYSPTGGLIRVHLATMPNHLEITVHDRGIGIPLADQKKLFNKFHRASNTDRLPGTGLGLAITKRAVEMHHGRISFSSTEGVGTSFKISLPTPSPFE